MTALAPARVPAVLAALFALALAAHPLLAAADEAASPEAPSCVGCHTGDPAPDSLAL